MMGMKSNFIGVGIFEHIAWMPRHVDTSELVDFLIVFRVLHTIFPHLWAHAFARSVTVARSSAVQASSSSRWQERRWAIVCGSSQSQSTD